MIMKTIVGTATAAILSSAWNGTNHDLEKEYHPGAGVGFRNAAAPTATFLPPPLPSWKIQDIIRLVILPILFAVGAPLNLAALSHLMSEKKTTSAPAARMHLLKLHLNISDLMILFVYTASQICWLITYEWRGGEFLCKFVKFSHTLSFGISSNVVVCIAFDRLASVFESKRRRSDERRKPGLPRVKISLLLAWTAAVACALPQFFVWTTYRPIPNNSWTQCVSTFFVHEAAMKRNPNSTAQNPLLITKTEYAAFHVLVIFWIPALIIAVCYLNVMAWLCCHGRGGGGNHCSVANDASGRWRYWQCCCYTALRSRVNSNTQDPNAVIESKCRYASMGKTKATQVGIMIDEGTSTKGSLIRGDYGAVEPPFDGLGAGGVSLANPTSPKGSGCSSTPLLGPGTGEHRPSGSGSRTASANIVVTPAVLDLQRVKRRAMRSSFLLVMAYIATWLPYNVIALWGLIDERHYKQYGVSVSFLQYLIVVNSVINPFLYGTVGRLRKYVTNG